MAMQMLFSSCRRGTTLSCALLLVLATALSGCASKNPLMDGSDASAEATKTSTPTTVKTTTSKLDQPTPSVIQRWISIIKPYKIDVQQGNFVSSESLALLKEGMTKAQVRFILGTPLLVDMFHDWRWDYIFRLHRANGNIMSNRVTVFFENDRVARIASTNLPSEADYIAHIINPEAALEERN